MNSLAYTSQECKHHIVSEQKHRQQIIYEIIKIKTSKIL